VGLGAVGAVVGPGQEGEDVVDLVGVLGRLRSGLLEQAGLHPEERRPEQGAHVEQRRDEQPLGRHPGLAGGGIVAVAARAGRPAAGPGAAQAEVDPPGVEGVEQAELLDHRQRGVVAHEHRSRPDPDPLGGRGHQPDHQRGRGPGHSRVEVVLGHPVAAVARGLAATGQIDAVVQRLASGRAAGQRHEVEH
jgi:hypothetical protein